MKDSKVKSQKSKFGKSRGFSLFELILVFGLIIIVGATSAPALLQFLNRSYFTDGVDKFVRTLRTAQIYSVSGKNDSPWGVHYESGPPAQAGKLVIFKGTNYSTRDSSFDVVSTIPSAVSVAGWSDVYFDQLRGLPSTTLSLVISVSNRTGAISLNSEGMVDRP